MYGMNFDAGEPNLAADQAATCKAIATDTVALLSAFIDKDFSELEFRALLLVAHAERLGLVALVDASRSLVAVVKAQAQAKPAGPLLLELERVVAAAAGAIRESLGAGRSVDL